MIRVIDGFDPDHLYYDQRGQPITEPQWFQLCRADRTLCTDDIILPDKSAAQLVTVWRGLVNPAVGARLYGTAICADGAWTQIQGYDSERQALVGHMSHVEATLYGYHCELCRLHEPHQE